MTGFAKKAVPRNPVQEEKPMTCAAGTELMMQRLTAVASCEARSVGGGSA